MKKFIATALILVASITVYSLTLNNKDLCDCSEAGVCTVANNSCKCSLCYN